VAVEKPSALNALERKRETAILFSADQEEATDARTDTEARSALVAASGNVQ